MSIRLVIDNTRLSSLAAALHASGAVHPDIVPVIDRWSRDLAVSLAAEADSLADLAQDIGRAICCLVAARFTTDPGRQRLAQLHAAIFAEAGRQAGLLYGIVAQRLPGAAEVIDVDFIEVSSIPATVPAAVLIARPIVA